MVEPGGSKESLAPRSHWEADWKRQEPRLVTIVDGANYIHDQFITIFKKYMRRDGSARCVEVGCAHSLWMWYLRETFDFEVSGLDYSASGCATTRQMYRNALLGGDIACRDVFGDNSDLEGRFDYVVSFGLVEHYPQPLALLTAMHRMLRPGGRIITTIPNTGSSLFQLNRWLDPGDFAIHHPHDAASLASAHEQAGFGVVAAGYFGTFDPSTLSARNGGPALRRTSQIVRRVVDRAVYPFLRRLNVTPQSASVAPYIYVVGSRE